MCVIVHLLPNQNLTEKALFNAVHNNSHGWGIILRDGNNKLQVMSGLADPDTKLPDVEGISKILRDNEDCERFLHVRNNTRGDDSEDNLHPFNVYNSNKKSIYFMHNGTLAGYGEIPESTHMTSSQKEWNEKWKGYSDSRAFAEEVLQPLLLNFKNQDMTQPFFMDILEKFFGVAAHNKAVLVSNQKDDVFIGSWEYVTDISEGEAQIKVSNDTYFTTLKRGPYYEERKAKMLAEVRKKQQERSSANSKNSVALDDVDEVLKALGYIESAYDSAFDDLAEIDTFSGIFSYEGISKLAFLSQTEVCSALSNMEEENREDLIYFLIDHITYNFNQLFTEYKKLQGKADKQQNFIQDKIEEINDMQHYIDQLEEKKVVA